MPDALAVAQALNATASTAFDKIRNSATLNPQAKTASMAKVYAKLIVDMDKAKASAFSTPVVDLKALELKLFGLADQVAKGGDLGSLSASYRDARDRAAAAQADGTLLYTFTGAEDVGDELLSRACAAEVYFSSSAFGSDTTVLESYLAARPAASAVFVELQDSRSQDLTGNLIFQWNFIPLKPPELANYSDNGITVMATSPLAG